MRGLRYIRDKLTATLSGALDHMWRDETLTEVEWPGDEEMENLQSKECPTPAEFASFNIGTSLSATVRAFWEQTGHDRFSRDTGIRDDDDVQRLKQAIQEEEFTKEDRLSIIKKWEGRWGRLVTFIRALVVVCVIFKRCITYT